MAQKTFTFTKKPKDLSNNPECMANIVKVGKLKFTMKDFHFNPHGHDDSLAYTGLLLLDKKPLARCCNDGWGGQTIVDYLPTDINEIEEIVSGYKWKYGRVTIDLRVDFIADILAETSYLTENKKG